MNAETRVTAHPTEHLGMVAIRSGLMTMYLERDQAHALVDQIRDSLRELAEQAAELHRDEDQVRAEAALREDM